MVKDPGTATRAGAIKPLNAPEPIEVETDAEGLPVALRLPVLSATNRRTLRKRAEKRPEVVERAAAEGYRGSPRPAVSPRPSGERVAGGQVRGFGTGVRVNVACIDDRWKVVDEWWRGNQMIARMYYSLVLESSQRVTVFQDLAAGAWYRQVSSPSPSFLRQAQDRLSPR